MIKRTKLRKVLGLEGLVEVDNSGINGIPESTSAIDGLIETTMAGEEKVFDEIDSAKEDIVLLESMRDEITPKIESGEGITSTSATIIQHTLESLYLRYGFSKRSLPPRMALENFKSKKTRLRATSITLESIVDLIGSIGKYVAKKFLSFVEWWGEQWERVKDILTDNHKSLMKLKEVLKNTKSMKDVGKPTQIKWISKHVFGNQAISKWEVASANLKSIIRATDLERKAWKQVQEYLGNPNKNMKEFMKPDPYGLGKFSPYLGVGAFISRGEFNRKASVVLSLEVPSIPKLMEFVDDGLTLVGPAAINLYDNIQAEIFRYEDMVTEYNYETGTTIGKDGKTSTTITSKAEIKKEYQIAIDMARDLIHTFWQMRCKAARSVYKISNFFITKFSNN